MDSSGVMVLLVSAFLSCSAGWPDRAGLDKGSVRVSHGRLRARGSSLRVATFTLLDAVSAMCLPRDVVLCGIAGGGGGALLVATVAQMPRSSRATPRPRGFRRDSREFVRRAAQGSSPASRGDLSTWSLGAYGPRAQALCAFLFRSALDWISARGRQASARLAAGMKCVLEGLFAS